MRLIPAPPTECLFCGSPTNRFTEEHVWPSMTHSHEHGVEEALERQAGRD
jgi:hypothetical protein